MPKGEGNVVAQNKRLDMIIVSLILLKQVSC